MPRSAIAWVAEQEGLAQLPGKAASASRNIGDGNVDFVLLSQSSVTTSSSPASPLVANNAIWYKFLSTSPPGNPWPAFPLRDERSP
jgi:hypothetical protein